MIRHHHDSHVVPNSHGTMLLWMLLDGVGLAIIASCTILDGFVLWKDYFSEYLDFNYPAISFWFSGRTCQVAGLLLLIFHAASLQTYHEFEVAGMMMLTVGPILNIFACSIFDSGNDFTYIYNRQWMTTEIVELLGIVILDISMLDIQDHNVLIAEVLGFFTLGCASLLDFEYQANFLFPMIDIRPDIVHVADCVGLFMLTIVAIGQYLIKLNKSKMLLHQQSEHHSINNNSPIKLSNTVNYNTLVVKNSGDHFIHDAGTINDIESKGIKKGTKNTFITVDSNVIIEENQISLLNSNSTSNSYVTGMENKNQNGKNMKTVQFSNTNQIHEYKNRNYHSSSNRNTKSIQDEEISEEDITPPVVSVKINVSTINNMQSNGGQQHSNLNNKHHNNHHTHED